MATISLCMIVKNEEKSIARCLRSVKGAVDEIIIVDTGSTDKTIKEAKAFTKKIFHFKWVNDFSKARNFSFQQATMDYIMWMDADDVLEEIDRKKLQLYKHKIDPNIDVIIMPYHTSKDEFGNVILPYSRERIIKRTHKHSWVGMVHEYIEFSFGRSFKIDIAVTHRPRQQKNHQRNLQLYENAIADGILLTPRDKYYYANELKDNERYEEAIEIYQKFVNKELPRVEEPELLMEHICFCYERLHLPEEEIRYALKSLEYGLPRAEACCRLGYYWLQKNEPKRALFWYDLATTLTKPKSWGFRKEACWTWLPHLQLCVCYDRLEQFEQAYKHNELARAYRPADPIILGNRAYLTNRLEEVGIPIPS
ncbi:glycosyl transferase [Brevibacillus laterosporus]|uniref:tetratricopeptide repeat-containing glycosyltransferase family 2 protein n=1 Tax=Brevibacillus laterosporus TaxID=1465 RepID=UPI000CE56773|nr:glycosyltransferase [Brevibacillus laterosporus]MBG9801873.1 glycosyl transferase [Brevibacillus laterosporus]MED4762611.1 glycosyltransferase [Brevibacillus laterosporus]PPA85376.1 glycosyl transferase [Brevibacillus laterosporus]TPH18673.1 glycosyltransferase [Brevibacillus laterosporus]